MKNRNHDLNNDNLERLPEGDRHLMRWLMSQVFHIIKNQLKYQILKNIENKSAIELNLKYQLIHQVVGLFLRDD